MNEVTLRRRVAVLLVTAFLMVMGGRHYRLRVR